MSVTMFPILQKPRFGDPCNRCGVCCRKTPCLIANALLRQYSGACDALIEHSDGSTSCDIVERPERYMKISAIILLYSMNGPTNRKSMGPAATASEIVLDALGDGSCDMVQRCGGGRDIDIPYGADLDAIKAERMAERRQRDPTT
jgi:hypothetical protein